MSGPPVFLQRLLYGRLQRRIFAGLFAFICGRAVRSFEEDVRNPARANEETLRLLLLRHRDTEFGRAHGFGEILRSPSPFAEFRRRVPLSTYADYDATMERLARGEHNLLTADRVVFFAPSSGTTGRPKLIPMTEHSMRHTLRTLFLSRAVLAKVLPGGARAGRGISLVKMSDDGSRTAGGIPTGDASGAGMRRAAWVLPYLYTTPLTGLEIDDRPTALFVHLLFGLRERDLSHVSATFAHYVLQLFRTLEARWPELLQAIATGRLPADLALTAARRRDLESLLTPDPQLAELLRPEFDRGMLGIAKRVWPRFGCVAAVATGTFEVYVPHLREYLGDALICNLIYGATESSLGVSVAPGQPRQYALIPRTCVYEFIPVERADELQPSTVDLADLEQDREYELVITSDAGFYRYRMDDVLRVAGRWRGTPVVEFAWRRGTILNIAAEKTTEQQVADVVRNLREQWLAGRAELVDYTVMADATSNPPRYRFFIELDGLPDLADEVLHRDAVRALDEGLAAANVDYAALRRARGIGEPRVDFLAAGTFDALLQLVRDSVPVHNDNTIKIPRLVRDATQLEFLEARSLAPIMKCGANRADASV